MTESNHGIVHDYHQIQEIVYSSQDAIQAVIRAEGDLNLAGELLFGHSEVYDNKARLVALLAEDPTAHADLQRILRTLTLMEAFATFKEVATAVRGTLENMETNQRARFMKQLLDSVAILTDEHVTTQNVNATRLNLSLTEAVYKSLPPDVQQALKVLNDDPGGIEDAGWSLADGIPNAAEGTDDS